MSALFKVAVVVCVVVMLSRNTSARNPNEMYSYSIPQPKIEVFTPRGFRVSVEDANGLRLFAFHGSINRELIDLDAGRYSKESRHPQNGRWTVEDKQARLHVGDKIYYWVFVIKDSLGYRLDKQCFIVSELLPTPFHLPESRPSPSYNTDPPYYVDSVTNPPIPQPAVEYATRPADSSKDLFLCEETILNTTQVLISLRTEVEKLKTLNKLLLTGLDKYPGSKQLKLLGRFPEDGTALSVVRLILREKLDSKVHILWAVKEQNAIVFEVPSVADKFEVLAVAKDKLKNSKFELS